MSGASDHNRKGLSKEESARYAEQDTKPSASCSDGTPPAKCFPFRAEDQRWSSPFGRFVDFFGADELVARVGVHPSAVYHWLGGRAQPRPAIAMKIRRLASSSGFSISFDDIYQDSRESRVELCPLDSITATPTRMTRMRRANRLIPNTQKRNEDK